MTGDCFLKCTKRKKIQFWFRQGFNAKKKVWCNADIQMFSALCSVAHVYCKKSVFFEWMHLFCVGTKYLVLLQLMLLYTIAILSLNYDEEKGTDNSRKFLDLDGNMSVMLVRM